MNKYLDIAPEVAEALAAGKPVVALESTIISHGMPYPQNVETALKVESIIRECGAVPATIAIIGGRLKAGLSKEEIDYLGRTGAGIPKASRRDLPVLVAQGKVIRRHLHIGKNFIDHSSNLLVHHFDASSIPNSSDITARYFRQSAWFSAKSALPFSVRW